MILSRNRAFKREEPTEEAIKIVIVCEGIRREGDYFSYFEQLDSRVEIEVIRPLPDANNSPTGLFEDFQQRLVADRETGKPILELQDYDEVWFVIDTDRWGDKITELRWLTDPHPNYHVVQSNPCFEVWLYYHFHLSAPNFANCADSRAWKPYLNEAVPGGFNPQSHPIHLPDATRHAEHTFERDDAGNPAVGCTELYLLGQRLHELLGHKLASARRKFGL